jgi:hypothetical protein
MSFPLSSRIHATSTGHKALQYLNIGESVYTPQGFRKILVKADTSSGSGSGSGGGADMILIVDEMQGCISIPPDNILYVNVYGWLYNSVQPKKAKDIAVGDTLVGIKELRKVNKVEMQSQSSAENYQTLILQEPHQFYCEGYLVGDSSCY